MFIGIPNILLNCSIVKLQNIVEVGHAIYRKSCDWRPHQVSARAASVKAGEDTGYDPIIKRTLFSDWCPHQSPLPEAVFVLNWLLRLPNISPGCPIVKTKGVVEVDHVTLGGTGRKFCQLL